MNKSIITLYILSLMLLLGDRSFAEHSGQFFLGYSKTAAHDVSASVTATYFSGGTTTEEAQSHETFDNSFIIGGGYRYWIEHGQQSSVDIGLGGGGAYFKDESGRFSFKVLPLSVSLWVGGRLFADEQYPRGKLMPYLGLGFAFAVVDGSVDFRPEMSRRVNGIDDCSGILGVLGVGYRLEEKTALFVELRYYGLNVDIEDEAHLWGRTEEIDTRLETLNMVIGVAL